MHKGFSFPLLLFYRLHLALSNVYSQFFLLCYVNHYKRMVPFFSSPLPPPVSRSEALAFSPDHFSSPGSSPGNAARFCPVLAFSILMALCIGSRFSRPSVPLPAPLQALYFTNTPAQAVRFGAFQKGTKHPLILLSFALYPHKPLSFSPPVRAPVTIHHADGMAVLLHTVCQPCVQP